MGTRKTDPVVAILDAARRCYLEDGIAATGMKQVAARLKYESRARQSFTTSSIVLL